MPTPTYTVALAGLVAAAGVYVIQKGGIGGAAFHRRFVDGGQQVVGSNCRQPSAKFADRAARTIDEDGFHHDCRLSMF